MKTRRNSSSKDLYINKWSDPDIYHNVYTPFKNMIRDMENIFAKKIASLLLEYINIDYPSSILDVGCGDGAFTQLLLSDLNIKISSYTGVDINQSAIGRCQDRFNYLDDVLFLNKDINLIDLDKKYDLILIMNSSYGLSNSTILRMPNYLTNNGYMAILTNRSKGYFAKLMSSEKNEFMYAEHVEDLFNKSNFEIVRISQLKYSFVGLTPSESRIMSLYLNYDGADSADYVKHQVENLIIVSNKT